MLSRHVDKWLGHVFLMRSTSKMSLKVFTSHSHDSERILQSAFDFFALSFRTHTPCLFSLCYLIEPHIISEHISFFNTPFCTVLYLFTALFPMSIYFNGFSNKCHIKLCEKGSWDFLCVYIRISVT